LVLARRLQLVSGSSFSSGVVNSLPWLIKLLNPILGKIPNYFFSGIEMGLPVVFLLVTHCWSVSLFHGSMLVVFFFPSPSLTPFPISPFMYLFFFLPPVIRGRVLTLCFLSVFVNGAVWTAWFPPWLDPCALCRPVVRVSFLSFSLFQEADFFVGYLVLYLLLLEVFLLVQSHYSYWWCH